MKNKFSVPTFRKSIYALSALLLSLCSQLVAANTPFELQAGKAPTVLCLQTEAPVVQTALTLFCKDYQQTMGAPPNRSEKKAPDILVGTVGVNPIVSELPETGVLVGKHEAFLIKVIFYGGKQCLLVAGSDKRGTAYGILEVSRLLGVSPWEWWADATPEPLDAFRLPGSFSDLQEPSVQFRGIFINDEDWGLTPWSWQTFEPSDTKGQIGPRTHARIFELLLRLRANTFWPAMHECSVPFYVTPGNKETADQYGIYIGTSHCEPMMRNTNGEWKREGKGEYDYIHNAENVYSFWEDRIKEVAGSDNYYTLGMRGVHDGKMNGAKTIEEQKTALTRILKDQRKLLAQYVNPDVTSVPQVFIPYKEVLDVYHAGLEVPQDVTLMWCDDNYGYIRHFPTPEERARKGGNGIYYHISYWGRPHDYLWLGTTHPALIYQQMKQAYLHEIRKVWIVNVGDLKPAEYQTELFLDMAWNIHKVEEEGTTAHLRNWLTREFGRARALQILPLLQEHYRLAYIRKPEFMGNTRVEEQDPAYKVITDLPWSETEIRTRLTDYEKIAQETTALSQGIPVQKREAFYQLVEYPILAAAAMNKKLLTAQLARHQKAQWEESDAAYDSIAALTLRYQQLAGGKWQRMMDFQPRRLPVFQRVPHSQSSEALPQYMAPLQILTGSEYTKVEGAAPPTLYEGLGYGGKAASLPKGTSLSYLIASPLPAQDSICIELRVLPNHPAEGEFLRLSVAWDENPPQTLEYQTKGRSEEWKMNVLRNQAIRRVSFPLAPGEKHLLHLKALDEGVVVDQIVLFRSAHPESR